MSGVQHLVVEANWKYKKPINIFFARLRSVPIILRFLIRVIWVLRFTTRKFKRPSPDNIGGVVVNDLYKLIYIGNPKVASSSMKSIFLNSLPESQFYLDISFAAFLQQNPDRSDYTKFSFVRDPIERIYSCWQDKISNQKRFADIFIITRFKSLYPDMPFDEFVDWLLSEEGKDKYADRHWMSQSVLLNAQSLKYGNVCYHDIKDLNKVVENFVVRNGLQKFQPRNINHLNSETNIRDLISNETQARLYKRYLDDYEHFKFRKPDFIDNNFE